MLEGSELCCNVRVAGSQGMWALKKVGPACILERGPVWGKDLEVSRQDLLQRARKERWQGLGQGPQGIGDAPFRCMSLSEMLAVPVT